jgi:hypothetical protein
MMDQMVGGSNESLVGNDKVVLYPNPAQNLLHMSVEGNESSTMSVTLSDVLSRQLVEKTYPISKGKNQYDLDLSDLKEGQYTLTFQQGSDRFVRRIAVKK